MYVVLLYDWLIAAFLYFINKAIKIGPKKLALLLLFTFVCNTATVNLQLCKTVLIRKTHLGKVFSFVPWQGMEFCKNTAKVGAV